MYPQTKNYKQHIWQAQQPLKGIIPIMLLAKVSLNKREQKKNKTKQADIHLTGSANL
jgi:hypothetical protein